MARRKIEKTLYVREVVSQYQALDTKVFPLSSPGAVTDFIREKIGDSTREFFTATYVDNKNTVILYAVISIGTVSEAIVHPREIFGLAVEHRASGVIVAHNHPSGKVDPSQQDKATTKRLVDAGKIIGIPLLDHIIVGFNTSNYFSMKEEGFM